MTALILKTGRGRLRPYNGEVVDGYKVAHELALKIKKDVIVYAFSELREKWERLARVVYDADSHTAELVFDYATESPYVERG